MLYRMLAAEAEPALRKAARDDEEVVRRIDVLWIIRPWAYRGADAGQADGRALAVCRDPYAGDDGNDRSGQDGRHALDFVIDGEDRRFTFDDRSDLDLIVAYAPQHEPIVIAPIELQSDPGPVLQLLRSTPDPSAYRAPPP